MRCYVRSQRVWLIFKIRQKQSKSGSIHILQQLDPGKALWSLIWVICSFSKSAWGILNILKQFHRRAAHIQLCKKIIYFSNLIFRKREAGLRWAASAVEPGHPANVKCNSSERRKSNFSLNHIKYFQAALYLFDGGKHTVGKRPPQQSNLWKICKTKIPSFICLQRSQSKYVKYLGLDLINGFELLSAINNCWNLLCLCSPSKRHQLPRMRRGMNK